MFVLYMKKNIETTNCLSLVNPQNPVTIFLKGAYTKCNNYYYKVQQLSSRATFQPKTETKRTINNHKLQNKTKDEQNTTERAVQIDPNYYRHKIVTIVCISYIWRFFLYVTWTTEVLNVPSWKWLCDFELLELENQL